MITGLSFEKFAQAVLLNVCRAAPELSSEQFLESHLSLNLLHKMTKWLSFENFSLAAEGCCAAPDERWGAGVETQKNVREEIGGWGRVPFNEPYAPPLSTIYDGA